MINSKIETVSPQMAERYLQTNDHNRLIRWRHVDNLKADILGDRWMITHQGIAFDTEGKLLDGQHRLLAIRASGRPVQMMVTRGVEPHRNGTVNLFAMDVIDCGNKRTAPDQLHLMHGIANANLVVGALRVIVNMFVPAAGKMAINVGLALPLIEIYGETIARLIKVAGNQSRLCRKSVILGVLATGSQIDAAVADEFMRALSSGENIKSGDPVYALREYMIANGCGPKKDWFIEITANCFYHTLKGNTSKILKSGAIGIEHLKAKQKENVDRVRALFAKV